jgi:hypothetical protein
MKQLSPAPGEILTLQAVQRRKEQFRLPVVNFPDVAPGFGVAELTENLDTMVAVEDLEFAGLVRVWAHHDERIPP